MTKRITVIMTAVVLMLGTAGIAAAYSPPDWVGTSGTMEFEVDFRASVAMASMSATLAEGSFDLDPDHGDTITKGPDLTVKNLGAAPLDVEYSTIRYIGVKDSDGYTVPSVKPDRFASYTVDRYPDGNGGYSKEIIFWESLNTRETPTVIAFALIAECDEEDGEIEDIYMDLLPDRPVWLGTLASGFDADNASKTYGTSVKTGLAWTQEHAGEHRYEITLVFSLSKDGFEPQP